MAKAAQTNPFPKIASTASMNKNISDVHIEASNGIASQSALVAVLGVISDAFVRFMATGLYHLALIRTTFKTVQTILNKELIKEQVTSEMPIKQG